VQVPVGEVHTENRLIPSEDANVDVAVLTPVGLVDECVDRVTARDPPWSGATAKELGDLRRT